MLAAQLVGQRAQLDRVVVLVPVVHDHRSGQVGEHERLEGVQAPVAEQVVRVQLGAGHQQGLLGPTFSGVSSQLTAYATVIRARIRASTSASSPAARSSMPCTNPTLGLAPVNDSSNSTQRCAGTNCATIRYTAKACRFGPYPTAPDRAPAGRSAVWTRPQPHRTTCWSYWVTLTDTSGISCC